MGKKNFRKIPDQIQAQMRGLPSDSIVVGVAKKVALKDVGSYKHLGLRVVNGSLEIPAPFRPSSQMGKYSRANENGKILVRRDLPKVEQTYSWEAPNWGDSSNGTHTIIMTREVYQRELVPPKGVNIKIELARTDPDGTFVVGISVDEVLDKKSPDFEKDLFYNLNILQENVGAVSLFASTTTAAQFAATVHLDWQILPPGKLDEVIKTMLKGKRNVTEEQRGKMMERLGILQLLGPQAYIAGSDQLGVRYFGAQFADDFVAFENLDYGNALYVMYEKWKELSRRSRLDLLKGPRNGFVRIPHAGNWRQKIENVLDAHREVTRRRNLK